MRALAFMLAGLAAYALHRAGKSVANSLSDDANGDWPFLNPHFHSSTNKPGGQ